MSNQRVDEALSDYFSDLLGGAEPSADIDQAESLADAQIEQNIVDSTPMKFVLDPISSENLSVKDESIQNTPSEVAKREASIHTEDDANLVPEAKIGILSHRQEEVNNLSGLPDKSTVNDRARSVIKRHPLTSSKTESLNDELLPADTTLVPRARLETEIQADTDTDSYNEHKGRLERMLRQVTSLTANQDVSVKTKVNTQLKTSAHEDAAALDEAFVATLSVTAIATPEITPQKLHRVSEDADKVVDLKDTVEETTNVDVVPILTGQWNENGRPEWAQERFDILLLEVNGLQLAVPLITLGQIHEIDEEITPLFGQSDWFMGLQKTPDGNVNVVNTAKFIMPERYRDQHNYKYVISIHGLYWGLAVDNVKQPITIDPEAIRWRPKRDSRPWMAGMVKDHMCVLLDIPKIGEILQTQDKNRVV